MLTVRRDEEDFYWKEEYTAQLRILKRNTFQQLQQKVIKEKYSRWSGHHLATEEEWRNVPIVSGDYTIEDK